MNGAEVYLYPKCDAERIIPGDPLTKYKRLVKEAYESGYEHWRTMLGIINAAEQFGMPGAKT
jgi:hypothetical protein